MIDPREQERITREYYEQGKGYDMSTAELNRQRGKSKHKKCPLRQQEAKSLFNSNTK